MQTTWLRHFGEGLVKSAENLGLQSEPPTHPLLLEWLATEFVRGGWDLKALHRLIVTSATYRQDSRATAEQTARDPENELLARGPRFRVGAETIRDVALTAATYKATSRMVACKSLKTAFSSVVWAFSNGGPNMPSTCVQRPSGTSSLREA